MGGVVPHAGAAHPGLVLAGHQDLQCTGQAEDSLLEAGSVLVCHSLLEEGGLTPSDGVNRLRSSRQSRWKFFSDSQLKVLDY